MSSPARILQCQEPLVPRLSLHMLERFGLSSLTQFTARGSQTLLSLSQFCAGGTSGQKFIGVFTPTECRMYHMLSALPVIAELAKLGLEAERGSVQNGIYVRESL